MAAFTKATRKASKVRIAMIAPSGAGKTYTALLTARGLVGPDGKIAVIDTERGSASKYADEPEIAGSFDVIELDSFSPRAYIESIKDADEAGYDVIIIDSLSHAWSGKDGALQMVDDAKARSRSNNSFAAWREVTPVHNELIDAMLRCNMHLIATIRSKMEYVLEEDAKGRKVPRKVGMQPIQRDGMEYEFDVICDIDIDHTMVVSKSRYTAIADKVYRKPRTEIADALLAWLEGADQAPADNATGSADTGAIKEEMLASYRKEVVKHAESMGINLRDVVDMLKHAHGVQHLTDLSVDAAGGVMRDMERRARSFTRILETFRAQNSSLDGAGLVDLTHERLADKAAADHDRKPLRATPDTWDQWSHEFAAQGESEAKSG